MPAARAVLSHKGTRQRGPDGQCCPFSYRSLEVKPVCLAMRANILGPISSESAKAQVYSPRCAWMSCICEEPFRAFTCQPRRSSAASTFLPFELGHLLKRWRIGWFQGQNYLVRFGQPEPAVPKLPLRQRRPCAFSHTPSPREVLGFRRSSGRLPRARVRFGRTCALPSYTWA